MDTMEVELLNVIKYTTKDNRQRTMIHFRLIDDKANVCTDKFKGIGILDSYFNGHDVFDKIPLEYFGRKVNMTLDKVQNPTDPRKETTRIVKINDISLV